MVSDVDVQCRNDPDLLTHVSDASPPSYAYSIAVPVYHVYQQDICSYHVGRACTATNAYLHIPTWEKHT